MSNSKTPKLIDYLFEMYAGNFNSHASRYKGQVACPLCLRRFGRDALANRDVTVEHIIPSKLGGKLTTLTCKDCNNRAGTNLDAHLVRKLRAEDKFAGKGDSPLRGKITIGEGEFAADVTFSNVENINENIKIDMSSLAKHSNPKMQKLADNQIKLGVRKVKLSFNLQYDEISTHVAALRSAYLLMFYHFGYGYIKHGALDLVRYQIANPNIQTEVLSGVKILDSVPEDKNGIAVLTQPIELRCFFAVLDLSTKIERYWGVVLPGLDEAGYTVYQRWADAQMGKPMNLESCPFNPKYISDPQYKNIVEHFWRL